MKISIKVWIRPIVLLALTIGLVYFFYVMPGFSENLWTWLYNGFSAIVLLVSVFMYNLAIRDSYKIRALNARALYPGENKKWAQLWTLFESGFLVNHRKTTSMAQAYFNPDNMLSASAERFPVLAIIKAMPGTYTGLGILGTFMGFSAGLANFNTSTTETMQTSIKTLLVGINTAFNTSIVGVVLSIIFNFIFLQPLLKRLEQDCNALADRLDQEFYVDSTDHLKEIFAFEDDGLMWLPRDYNRQMLTELKSQSVSLSNFTTDLSDSMQNLAEALVASYRQEMNKMITEDLQPILQSLAASANKLQEDKEESTDQALEGIISRLNQTLTDFMHDFRENVEGQTKRELDGLSVQLKIAGDSIGSLPIMIDGLRNSFTNMAERSVNALNEAALQGSSLQSENISELRKLAEQMKLSMESYTRVLSTAETQNRHSEKIAENLEDVADSTAVAIGDLRKAFSEFKEQNEGLVASIVREAEGLKTAVSTVQVASQGFQGLDDALASSFETINSGLQEYRDATKDSLDKYLESYSNTFSQFAGKLASAVEQLSDLVEDLQETLEARK